MSLISKFEFILAFFSLFVLQFDVKTKVFIINFLLTHSSTTTKYFPLQFQS